MFYQFGPAAVEWICDFLVCSSFLSASSLLDYWNFVQVEADIAPAPRVPESPLVNGHFFVGQGYHVCPTISNDCVTTACVLVQLQPTNHSLYALCFLLLHSISFHFTSHFIFTSLFLCPLFSSRRWPTLHPPSYCFAMHVAKKVGFEGQTITTTTASCAPAAGPISYRSYAAPPRSLSCVCTVFA